MSIYKHSKELEGKQLQKDDTIVFKILSVTLKYKVWDAFLSIVDEVNNNKIFTELKIPNKLNYASQCYGYEAKSGDFPECNRNDYVALTRIAIALLKHCEYINGECPEPLYKVGDVVKVKSEYDLGKSEKDYPHLFTQNMLHEFGGKTFIINQVSSDYNLLNTFPTKEPYVYLFKDTTLYSFHESMFERVSCKENPITIEKSTSKKRTIMPTKVSTVAPVKKSMFSSFIDKYKAQFMPEEDTNLKMSMDGTVCVPVNDEYVGIDKGGNLTSYPAEMCLDVPVYLVAKPFAQVKVGDIIRANKSYMKVLKKTDNNTLNCLTFSGYTRNSREVKDFVLGQSLVKVVVNLFENTQIADSAAGFNPMMMLMLGGKDVNVKDMLMMQMLQGNVAQSQMNPMLMMAMMNDGESSSAIETMLMMQMMGTSGMFPFAQKVEEKKSKKSKTEPESTEEK